MSKSVSKMFFGIAIISLVLNLFMIRHGRMAKDDRDSWKSIAYDGINTAKLWRNKAGLSQAHIVAVEANTDIIKEHYGDSIKKLQQQVSGLKKDLSNLHSLTSVSLTTQGEVKTALRDTVYLTGQLFDSAKTFSYRDRWASIHGTFLRDSALVDYQFYDSLSVVSYVRRRYFIGRKQLFVDVISHNPHSSITGLRSIAVRTPRRSRFVLGPFVGVDYKLKPTIGFGLTYRLIEF